MRLGRIIISFIETREIGDDLNHQILDRVSVSIWVRKRKSLIDVIKINPITIL